MARAFSVEDRDLNTASIITSRTKLYRDIDLSFTARPSGEIYKKVDASAVKQSVKNILMTNHFEKPFNALFGGNLTDLLFDLADPEIDYDIKNNIVTAIEGWEPRAQILNIDVNVQPDYNAVNVTVEFKVVNTEEIIIFTTTLTRLR
mgnify:FL=1|jgi:phage baseplate assembly protein W